MTGHDSRMALASRAVMAGVPVVSVAVDRHGVSAFAVTDDPDAIPSGDVVAVCLGCLTELHPDVVDAIAVARRHGGTAFRDANGRWRSDGPSP